MKDNLYKSLINGDGMEKRASENNFLAAFSDGELQKLAEELAATISEEDKENKKEQNEDANENAATSGTDAKDVSDITGDNAEALTQKAKAQIEARKEPMMELIRTKNGFHVVTRPFNLHIFAKQYPNIQVHKDNMALIYCP